MSFFSTVPGLKVSSAWTADGEESQGGKNRSDNFFKIPVLRLESPNFLFLFHGQMQILINIHAYKCLNNLVNLVAKNSK